jgi:hypothetical protein
MPEFILTASEIISTAIFPDSGDKVINDDTDNAGSRFVYIEFSSVSNAAAYVDSTNLDPFAMIMTEPLRFSDTVVVRFDYNGYQDHADKVNGYNADSSETREQQYLSAVINHRYVGYHQ